MGAVFSAYWLLIVGRVVYGLGGECLCVAQNVVISNWFRDKNLALALGLNISVSRLGSTFNSIITPRVFGLIPESPYLVPLLLGLVMTVLSWLVGLVLNWLDRESDRREGKLNIRQSAIDDAEKIKLSDIKEFSLPLWILTANCALIYGAFFALNGNANDLLNKKFNISTE